MGVSGRGANGERVRGLASLLNWGKLLTKLPGTARPCRDWRRASLLSARFGHVEGKIPFTYILMYKRTSNGFPWLPTTPIGWIHKQQKYRVAMRKACDGRPLFSIPAFSTACFALYFLEALYSIVFRWGKTGYLGLPLFHSCHNSHLAIGTTATSPKTRTRDAVSSRAEHIHLEEIQHKWHSLIIDHLNLTELRTHTVEKPSLSPNLLSSPGKPNISRLKLLRIAGCKVQASDPSFWHTSQRTGGSSAF